MRVLVVFGGRSGEHEVSVVSSRAVVDALEHLGHEPLTVGITRGGRWTRCDPRAVAAVPEDGPPYTIGADALGPHGTDVAFPVLHGPYGEDGCIQGLFELADVPYVGSGVEGSAIGMNKVVHKRLFAAAGLPVVELVAFTRADWTARADELTRAAEKLGFPCYAKPAHLGSSVGISKVGAPGEIAAAVERALVHDDLVLIEASGGSRELEVGVIEDASGGVDVSCVGEIAVEGGFYDYRAKYGDSGATTLIVPAGVGDALADEIRSCAERAFRVSGAAGYARVDFFHDDAGGLVLNEINTAPGLTPVSMFPRVWAASGAGFPAVVARLLDHALARHRRKAALESARAAAHAGEIA